MGESKSLAVSSAMFSELGRRVLDGAARYLDELDGLPIRPRSSGVQTVGLFDGPPPVKGVGAAAFVDLY
jgi:hypothetical protein